MSKSSPTPLHFHFSWVGLVFSSPNPIQCGARCAIIHLSSKMARQMLAPLRRPPCGQGWTLELKGCCAKYHTTFPLWMLTQAWTTFLLAGLPLLLCNLIQPGFLILHWPPLPTPLLLSVLHVALYHFGLPTWHPCYIKILKLCSKFSCGNHLKFPIQLHLWIAHSPQTLFLILQDLHLFGKSYYAHTTIPGLIRLALSMKKEGSGLASGLFLEFCSLVPDEALHKVRD